MSASPLDAPETKHAQKQSALYAQYSDNAASTPSMPLSHMGFAAA